MIYFHPSSSNVWENINQERIGFIASPGCINNSVIEKIKYWCGDNGSFAGRFDEDRFFNFLKLMKKNISKCVFIVCPDTWCEAEETIEKWTLYSDRIRTLGYPIAFACQNGQENLPIPDNYDVLFIGGSDEWRVAGCGAIECIRKAKASGKWVHVGRVNSLKRVKHFMLEGVDSVDGTYVSFGPDKNYKSPMKWMAHQPLWKGEL